MDHLQWYDYIRIFTVVLAVYSAWRMSKNLRARAVEVYYSSQVKDFIWVIYASQVLIVEACVEGVTEDVQWAWRIPVQLFFELVCLRAVLRPLDPLEVEKEE